MSQAVVQAVSSKFGDQFKSSSDFRGDDVAIVDLSVWRDVALFLRDDPALQMNHFIDLTAVDYPEREPDEDRFELVLLLRSQLKNLRVIVKTQVPDGTQVPSLSSVWRGANWAEREVFDMFGLSFAEHPDLRRILMYEEFKGHPLRKDYPIERTQPLMPYRDVAGIDKLAPFGADEGQPFGRVDWVARLSGDHQQVSPAIARQTGERGSLSESTEAGIKILVEETQATSATGPETKGPEL